MKIEHLIHQWEREAMTPRTQRSYAVRLPLHDAARIAALAEMFPGRSEPDIITDLLLAALDELEGSLPYVPGTRGSVLANVRRGQSLGGMYSLRS